MTGAFRVLDVTGLRGPCRIYYSTSFAYGILLDIIILLFVYYGYK